MRGRALHTWVGLCLLGLDVGAQDAKGEMLSFLSALLVSVYPTLTSFCEEEQVPPAPPRSQNRLLLHSSSAACTGTGGSARATLHRTGSCATSREPVGSTLLACFMLQGPLQHPWEQAKSHPQATSVTEACKAHCSRPSATQLYQARLCAEQTPRFGSTVLSGGGNLRHHPEKKRNPREAAELIGS
ncbi:hypothetical protein NDU88_010245 [Pleurodeles waltl]|uniref:Uncharacterized protein n=1 Tax=Pleurodeles waltl TaxID=8319 RepID=A0AAV7Q1M9_PLEWA|nr:hypothetical protein NDU88_010245 [Pleurodeles waltl]